MPRILYVLVSEGGIQGGHKMVLRHVETLRDLGFDAWCYVAKQPPTWLDHRAPIDLGGTVYADDIAVVPDDANHQLQNCTAAPWRTVVFAQNLYYSAAGGALELLGRFPASNPPAFIAVAPRLAAGLTRLFPGAQVELIPSFADERMFGPGPKRDAIAYVPRKRQLEAQAIRQLFQRLHPQHAGLEWLAAENLSEAEMSRALASSTLHLSLSRLESLGMTTLEAMASGCVCAGFTGVGGAEYATPENGFWVADDDCEAAADALAEAAALVRAGGAPLRDRLEAGYETARTWSYAAFRRELEAVWTRLAPEARTLSPAS